MTDKNHDSKFNLALASAQPQRADLEKRLLEINTEMAGLTSETLRMPDDPQAKLQARMKQKQLVTPDTEVLRQLLLEKARISEQVTLLHASAPLIERKKKLGVQK